MDVSSPDLIEDGGIWNSKFQRSGLPKPAQPTFYWILSTTKPAHARAGQNSSFTLNRVELVEAVQKQLGKDTSKAEAERAVTAVINTIKAGVKKAKMVQLVGFGTFKVAERKARKGFNPKTRQQIRIPKSKTVKFSPGKDFKSKV
jgi:DNA-binding protein HU-beta